MGKWNRGNATGCGVMGAMNGVMGTWPGDELRKKRKTEQTFS